ncbi:MAG TPA: hypothetical protein VFV54_09540, partial [Thermoanaerobaculia bacterium]|nr:hypothetical protein [Thermoanaerobaculia bacterium]
NQPFPEPDSSRPPLVVISNERIKTHRPTDRLERICHTDHRVHACTELLSEGFKCRCERFNDGWAIVGEIEIDFVIHLADTLQLRHERRHIRDIESALPRRLQPLLATRFETTDSCSRIASMISSPAYAAAFLNDLATASNQSLGCSPIADAKPNSARARRDR